MENKPLLSFATISRLFRSARGERVVQTGQYQITALVTVASASGNTITFTGVHGGKTRDRVVFTSGADWIGEEFGSVETPSTSSFKLDYSFSDAEALAVVGLTCKVMRPVTATYDSSGGLTIVPGPATYIRNGSDQEVTEDTTTSANNRPLPTQVMAQDGTPQKTNLAPIAGGVIFIDASATAIPASGPAVNLELDASTASKVFRIEWQDDIGEYIGVYTGADPGTLVAIIGSGGSSKEVSIPAGTRVSVRAMQNTAITANFAAVHLMG